MKQITITDRMGHWRTWHINMDGLDLELLTAAMIERYEGLGVFVGGPYQREVRS
jgi:hypothetical protein